ncbi:MAG: DUF5063 domain-containing protein [Bacteroides sp.]|nr:DUF5063 domain-containing protein [Bacteroidales bacterium]MBD5368105.1 DUF5063 domain-containing protein [Bacteroides sp.]
MNLTPNALSFIALTNEYCQVMERTRETSREEFVRTMLKLLPRIYMAATDLDATVIDDDDSYIPSFLEEEYYESVRRNVETLLGPDDVYLEVFEEDMKYSDTPIAASIAEGLCDIFQVLYNFISTVRELAPEEMAAPLAAVKDDFGAYWSRPLCNVLRALNHVRYNSSEEEEDDATDMVD